jgi:hypothetical protein
MIFLACADIQEQSPALVSEDGTTALDAALVSLPAPLLLRRLSLDLRGVLPSVAELDQVEADAGAISTLRDSFLEDARFEERLVMLLGERWHTRVDEFLIYYVEYQALAYDATNEYHFERAIGEEPLRLMARIAAEDRPWTEIVTADYTIANETLAAIWPISRPEGSGWLESSYTDGRPGAGVLSTSGLWWRYYTTISNYNRGRAAAISRLFLCEDYLSRPVSFTNQVALVDASGIESALRSNPYCMGCHSSLDPVASTMFGFWVANEYNATEMHTYHPEREKLGSYLIGQDPGWYGLPLEGLDHMGRQIAVDPRFARCTAESFAGTLWRREVSLEDFTRIEGFRQAYLAGGEQLKPLLKAITDSAVYQAGSLTEAASELQLQEENTSRLMDVSLLRSVLLDLTGVSWSFEGFDMLDSDTYGFRILGGGVDGSLVTSPQRTPSLTWSLVVERAAEQAFTAGIGPALAGDTALFAGVRQGTLPDDATFGEELGILYWRFYGLRADESWKTAITELWALVQAREGEEAAWVALLTTMVRDPQFVGY